MEKLSVGEYAARPEIHGIKGKTVPKPSVFKQITENRLPENVKAEFVAGRWILTVYGPEDKYQIVRAGTDFKSSIFRDRELMEKAAEALNTMLPDGGRFSVTQVKE